MQSVGSYIWLTLNYKLIGNWKFPNQTKVQKATHNFQINILRHKTGFNSLLFVWRTAFDSWLIELVVVGKLADVFKQNCYNFKSVWMLKSQFKKNQSDLYYAQPSS
jgi:hypothetical protein